MTIRRFALIGFVVFMLGTLGACGGDFNSTGDEINPETLGEIGAKIYQNPQQTDSILSDYGLTRSEFEQKIEEATSDPERAEKYSNSFQNNLK